MKTHHLQRILKDRAGNFGIITAVLIPTLLATAGVALDLAQAMQMKSQIQGSADSAALAAAASMADKNTSEADAQTLAKNYIASQLLNYVATGKETQAELDALKKALKDAATVTTGTTTTTTGKGYNVTIKMNYNMQLNAMSSLLVGKTMKLATTSTAASNAESESAISMYLALDRSGSMSFVTDQKNPLLSDCANYSSSSWPNPYSYKPCYIRKIQAVQTASSGLFSSLDKADPKKTLVRVGAVSYTDSTQSPTDLAWGTTAAAKYVSQLPDTPTGGTDASGAMQIAFDALKVANTTESKAHVSKSHTNFQRYILLMTDGEMTGGSNSWNSTLDKNVRALCDKAKADKDANGNAIVIFTVAFMAPAKGKDLLNYCASNPDSYYEPDDMTALVDAFGQIAEKASKTATRLTN